MGRPPWRAWAYEPRGASRRFKRFCALAAALFVCASAGCASVDDRLAALASQDQEDRIEALIELSHEVAEGRYEVLRRRPEIAKALRERLHDRSALVRQIAIESLVRVEGIDAAQAIAERLGDQDPWVRYTAVRALGAIGAREAREQIEALLAEDESEDVRRAAAVALGRLGDPAAVRALYLALGDPSESVRRHAHRALVVLTGVNLGEDPRAWRRYIE